MLSAGQFRRALDRKYDIKERQSNADLLRARSTAGLQGSQANEIDTRVQQLGAPVSLGTLQSSLGAGLPAPQPAGGGMGISGPGLEGLLGQRPTQPTQPSRPSFGLQPSDVNLTSLTQRLGWLD